MKNNNQRWLKGMISSFIRGGSSAAAAGFGSVMLDPDKFNPVTQTARFFELTVLTFIVSGAHELFQFLKDNPVPDDGTQFITNQNNPPKP